MFTFVLMSWLTFGAPAPVLLAQAPSAGAADELLTPEKPAPTADKAAPAKVDPAQAAGAAPALPGNDKGDNAGAKAAAESAAPAEGEAAAEGDTGETGDEAAEGEAEPGLISKIFNQGAIGYMIQGGVFMWPILILGIIGGGVIIERYRGLQMLRTDTAGLRAEVQDLLQADKVEEAYALCDAQQGPVPAVLSTGLRQFLVLRRLGYDPARIGEQVVKAMDDYGVHIVAALERHLPILATISSVAPMIGFLGTVQGMVVAFDDIVRTMGETNIVEAAAAGIKVSLLTTLLGLVVGIPAFMAFNYFNSVINTYVLEVEESATELIEVVTLQMTMKEKSAAEGHSKNDQSVPDYSKSGSES